MHRPGIFLIRPLSHSDPSLMKINGHYLLPKVAKEMIYQKLLTEVIICIPETIPENIKELLGTWDLPLVVTTEEFPAERLNDLIYRNHYDVVACFSAYNYLIPGEAVQTAFKMIASREADVVYPSHVVTAKHFTVMNRAAANHLKSLSHLPLSPNRFHQKLKENRSDLKIFSLNHMEGAGERFLWDLYYAGAREIIPGRILRRHYQERTTKEWFDAKKFKALLADDLHIENWEWLDEFLADNGYIARRSTAFAAQFSWYRRWQKYIPADRDRFLEIGFGDFPVISFLILNRIQSGLAVEPADYSADGVSQALTLCDLLNKKIPALFRWNGNDFNAMGRESHRLQLSDRRLEKLSLPVDHIDFCFSRAVFEHVMDVESLSRELYRLMKPGSSMIHEIDFRDHSDGPTVHFTFLKYSKAEWTRRQQITNLWRINDYIELWERLGFQTEILAVEKTRLKPPQIDESWRNYAEDNLFCHTAVIRAVCAK